MRRLATVLALAATFLVVAPGPASADTVSFSDRRGDAEARYDLTKIRISHTAGTISVRANVRDLRGTGTQIFGINVDPVHSETVYAAHVVRRPSGRTIAHINGYGADGSVEVRCRIERAFRLGADRIDVSIPRACIKEPGPIYSSLFIGAGNGSAGDPSDWINRPRRLAQG